MNWKKVQSYFATAWSVSVVMMFLILGLLSLGDFIQIPSQVIDCIVLLLAAVFFVNWTESRSKKARATPKGDDKTAACG